MPFDSVLSALQYPVATQSAFGLGVKFPMEGHFGMGFGNGPVFRPYRRNPIAFLLKVLVPLTGLEPVTPALRMRCSTN